MIAIDGKLMKALQHGVVLQRTSCPPVISYKPAHPPSRPHSHTATWQVVLAALVSSTLLNAVFPFFTYLPSSGMLGERLPQVGHSKHAFSLCVICVGAWASLQWHAAGKAAATG